jgi:hypothetical protein
MLKDETMKKNQLHEKYLKTIRVKETLTRGI